jgi:RimJ/RimL family protein N-acetyltransferase
MNVLETDRLVLRWLAAPDAAFMLGLLNAPSFVRFVGDRGVRTVADAEAYIRDGPGRSYEAHGFGLYLVEEKGGRVPVGVCGLLKRESLDDVDVGFALLPEFESRGYAYEAAQATLDYGRDVLGLSRIVAIVDPENTASVRLLTKLGMEYERAVRLPGADSDVDVYATDERWGHCVAAGLATFTDVIGSADLDASDVPTTVDGPDEATGASSE